MKKVAVIGYGGQGAWHCAQIANSEVVELRGIYDIKEERRQKAREAGIYVYKSNESIFADKSVDVVVIATTNDVHEELAICALKNGKNVICEKPATLSVSSFYNMLKAERESGCLLSIHQNRRWDVDFLAIKQVIDSNEVGELIRIESRVFGSRGIPSDWRCKKAQGGGMILDWGVHLIDQVLQLIPSEISAVNCVTTHITNNEVEDGFRLELTYKNGKSAYVEVGTYNFLPLPRFYLQCKNGTVCIEDWQKKAHVAKLKAWMEKDITPIQNAAGITKTMAPRDELTLLEYDLERPISNVHEFYRNFVMAIDGKEKPIVNNLEIMRVLKVIETCVASNLSKQTIKVEI